MISARTGLAFEERPVHVAHPAVQVTLKRGDTRGGNETQGGLGERRWQRGGRHDENWTEFCGKFCKIVEIFSDLLCYMAKIMIACPLEQ